MSLWTLHGRRTMSSSSCHALLLSLLLILSGSSLPAVSAFVHQPSHVRSQSTTASTSFSNKSVQQSLTPSNKTPTGSTSTSLEAVSGLFSSAAVLARPTTIRAMILAFGATILAVLGRQSKLRNALRWPGSSQDSSIDAPLPDGSMGCPFLGNNVMGGTRDYGPYAFFNRMSKKLGNPKLFKLYAFGNPMVSVRGADNIQSLLKNEFDEDGVNTEMVSESYATAFGDESILYETSKSKHGLLRRLVGAAMTPPAIDKALPAIQEAAKHQVDTILSSTTPVKMEEVANDFTLDVAWRQILGLDLKEDEVATFHKAVKDWISGMFHPLFYIPFVPQRLLKMTKCCKARDYLVDKVERKLKLLEKQGPDGSTLSGIYFAMDEDGNKLTRKQVIDNALILIVAGSETSASTLTVAMKLLGLHPDMWRKIQEEQVEMRLKHGDPITSKNILDNECPYLQSVVQETLRLVPVPTMEFRRTGQSIVMDGQQIPKDWMVVCNVRLTHDNDPATYKENGEHMDLVKGFQPERWGSPETKPTEWMPFGHGARRCLGEKLAMTEMKVFLATMARKMNFDLVNEKVEWKKMSIMPRPLDGVEITPRAVSN